MSLIKVISCNNWVDPLKDGWERCKWYEFRINGSFGLSWRFYIIIHSIFRGNFQLIFFANLIDYAMGHEFHNEFLMISISFDSYQWISFGFLWILKFYSFVFEKCFVWSPCRVKNIGIGLEFSLHFSIFLLKLWIFLLKTIFLLGTGWLLWLW
jgi:hypothetical protein